MKPVDIVRAAAAREFVSEDGDTFAIELLPGLTEAEIGTFEQRLPCAVPPDVRELLGLCRGLTGLVDLVDFTGLEPGDEAIFPHGLPIAHDGFGNYWVVDLNPSSTAWAPIYFACHDAPVILYQSPTLEHFLEELVRSNTPPYESAIDDVHEDRPFRVWRENPGVMPYEECAASSDPQLAAFARELDTTFEVIDLREAEIGFGFSWGRYGPQTVVRRFGYEPVFAYQRREGFWRRLFGRQSRHGSGA